MVHPARVQADTLKAFRPPLRANTTKRQVRTRDSPKGGSLFCVYTYPFYPFAPLFPLRTHNAQNSLLKALYPLSAIMTLPANKLPWKPPPSSPAGRRNTRLKRKHARTPVLARPPPCTRPRAHAHEPAHAHTHTRGQNPKIQNR